MKAAETITTLASASLVFIPTLLGKLNPVPGVPGCFAVSLVLLGWSVVFGVGFMALLTFFYEEWMYSKDGETYTPWKYGLLRAAGFSALICFGLAYLWLAGQLATAAASGVMFQQL